MKAQSLAEQLDDHYVVGSGASHPDWLDELIFYSKVVKNPSGTFSCFTFYGEWVTASCGDVITHRELHVGVLFKGKEPKINPDCMVTHSSTNNG